MSWATTEAFGAYGDWDDDTPRARPNPKANRPRTKDRPDYSAAEVGRVVAVDRGRYTVLVGERMDAIGLSPAKRATAIRTVQRGSVAAYPGERLVLASRARELHRTSIVAGDLVRLDGDTSGEAGSLARIVRIEPRETLLRRSADDADRVERVIVANARRLFIVVATAQPEPRPRLIDRTLIAATDAGLEPVLVLTKTDLAPAAPLLDLVEPLGVRVLTSEPGSPPTDAMLPLLTGCVSLVIGHSGVGKSTLVNAIAPWAGRATGHVNEVTGRGRHTSSSSRGIRIVDADGNPGLLIDTPGVRSFGLGHVAPDAVARGFPDLAPVLEDCPRGCTHAADAPDCGLDETVWPDGAPDARIRSFRRLLESVRDATG